MHTNLQNFSIQQESGTLNALLYFGKNSFDVKSSQYIHLDVFLDNVAGDVYQEYAFKVRSIVDKIERDELKKRDVPLVCISGYGPHRSNGGITLHSGFIGIDVDDIDPKNLKKQLRSDPYVFSVFESISGEGACVIFKIDGKKHSEAFEGLATYLYERYKVVADPRCKEISRARYVSWDPALILNEGARAFRTYPKTETKSAKRDRCKSEIGVKKDIEEIILKEIEDKGLDIVPNYDQWLNVAFSLANEFGEDGRNYFHRISSIGDYSQTKCDRQFTACLKSDQGGHSKERLTTINYLFNLCKASGIATESPETAAIKKAAYTQSKAGSTIESITKNLEKFAGYPPEETRKIVEQVWRKTVESGYTNEDISDIECITEFLKVNYSLRLNEITGILENDGVELQSRDINTIELSIREKFPRTDYTTISKIMDSNFIEKYHPIKEFFHNNIERQKKGSIDVLASCIRTDTGYPICEERTGGTGYVQYFLKKWLVGMVACVYQNVSPLMLILCGKEQGTGKTYFFENLLPTELKKYCTIKNLSSLTSDTFKRDMDIAVSRFWLIYDDEMSGKSKRDQGAIKALLSTSETNVRAAYAKTEENRKRIATFGGTTNETQDILSDHTGNRRYIPIEVESIDFEKKDRIDPVDYIMEAYHLYHERFDYRVLGSDMSLLNDCTPQFKRIDSELEMVVRYYKAPTSKFDSEGVYRTATDIKNKLEVHTKDKLNHNKLSAALRAIGIEGKQQKIQGVFASWYFVVEKHAFENRPYFEEAAETLPF